MTVFSGVSHPSVDGGHPAEKSFLTAAPHPGSGAFRNSVSLDQVAAERIGTLTRIPVLVTRIGVTMNGSLSYTRGGVEIPPERSVAALYRQMFVQGTAKEINARLNDLKQGQERARLRQRQRQTAAKGPRPARTAIGSISTSPAFATWRTSFTNPRSGRRSRSRWSRRPSPKTPP